MSSDPTSAVKSPEPARQFGARFSSRLRSIDAWLRSRAFLVAIVSTVGLFVLFWWRLTPTFNTNDDVHTMWIADGTFFHEPYEHLLITTVIIGRVMTFLYGIAGSINWYPYYLYLIHLVAFATIVYVVVADRRFRIISHGAALLGLFMLFYLWAWMNLQFTSASLLLGIGALILYAARAPLEKTPIWVMGLAGAMLGLVSWIRVESWQGAMALAFPIFIVTVRKVPWRRQVVFAGTVLIIFLFSVAFENLYYVGQDDWQEYRAFNQVRGDLHATPRVEGLAARGTLLDDIGWSKNDVTMFRFWFFMDEDVYTTEALAAIREVTRSQRNELSEGFDDLRADKWTNPRLVFLGGLFLFAMFHGGWRRRGIGILTILWVGVLGSYLVMTLRWPDRVAVPMLAFIGLTLLLVPTEPHRDKPTWEGTNWYRFLQGASVALLVLAVLLTVPRGLQWHRTATTDNIDKLTALDVTLNGLDQLDPNGIFVTQGPALVSRRLEVKNHVDVPIDMVHLGWQARSPVHVEHAASHGIDDVYAAISLRDDVYFVAKSGDTPQELFNTYMAEHYGWAGQLRPAGRFGFSQETTAYDLLVDYRYDGEVLVESLPDGTKRRIVISEVGGSGGIHALPDFSQRSNLTGWAVDPATGLNPDLIVVMHDDGLGRMVVTSQPRQAIARELRLPPNQRIGFSVGYTAQKNPPDEVRVFAVFGDVAVELFLEEGSA